MQEIKENPAAPAVETKVNPSTAIEVSEKDVEMVEDAQENPSALVTGAAGLIVGVAAGVLIAGLVNDQVIKSQTTMPVDQLFYLSLGLLAVESLGAVAICYFTRHVGSEFMHKLTLGFAGGLVAAGVATVYGRYQLWQGGSWPNF